MESALIWQLNYGKPETLDFLRAEQERTGETIEALEAEPALEPDLDLLLMNFLTLHSTRQSAFEGFGAIAIGDMKTIHEEHKWIEAWMELQEFIDTMLFLDRVLRKWHKDRS